MDGHFVVINIHNLNSYIDKNLLFSFSLITLLMHKLGYYIENSDSFSYFSILKVCYELIF